MSLVCTFHFKSEVVCAPVFISVSKREKRNFCSSEFRCVLWQLLKGFPVAKVFLVYFSFFFCIYVLYPSLFSTENKMSFEEKITFVSNVNVSFSRRIEWFFPWCVYLFLFVCRVLRVWGMLSENVGKQPRKTVIRLGLGMKSHLVCSADHTVNFLRQNKLIQVFVTWSKNL